MGSVSTYIIIFLISLAFAALFAYLETLFTSLRLFEVNQLEARLGRYKKLFATWRSAPQRLLITILIASNFADILCSVLIADVMQALIGGELGLAIGVFSATVLILLFGNILPKSLAKTGTKDLSPWSLGFISVMLWFLSPIVSGCMILANFISRRFRGHEHDAHGSGEVSEDEIEFLIDYSDQKGLMESDKSEMLQNVFGLGQTSVASVMVPKHEMVTLDVNTSLARAQELFSSYRYSRIPLFDKKEENIVGFIYQKDLLGLMYKKQDCKLRDFMRPVIFVPETTKVNQLLREFLKTKSHLAITIDEYGSVVGLVTLEDVLEEIVGEIRDEHEEVGTDIMPLANGEYVIHGRVELKRVEELLGISLSSTSSITLGGFLSERLQRVPKKGEGFVHHGYLFQVQQASMRKVLQVLISPEVQEHGEG